MTRTLFVDLDGTFVLGNSYMEFLRACWLQGDLRMRLILAGAIANRAVSGRRGRLRMKVSIARSFGQLDEVQQQAIVDATTTAMRRIVSRPVQEKVESFRSEGWAIVLATAALDCYATQFSEELGFDHCIASPPVIPGLQWQECWGSIKADRCRTFASALHEGALEMAAMSDHADDLPLLRACSSVVIQASASESKKLAASLPENVQVSIIDPLAAEGGGGIWLWFMDAPSGPHDPWEVRTILSKHRYSLMYVGDGAWRRTRPGDSLTPAVLRVHCPRPPSALARISVALSRKIVRDSLQIFH